MKEISYFNFFAEKKVIPTKYFAKYSSYCKLLKRLLLHKKAIKMIKLDRFSYFLKLSIKVDKKR